MSFVLNARFRSEQIHKVMNRNSLAPNMSEIADSLREINQTRGGVQWNNYTYQNFDVVDINETLGNVTNRLQIYLNSTPEYANTTFVYGKPNRKQVKRMEVILRSQGNLSIGNVTEYDNGNNIVDRNNVSISAIPDIQRQNLSNITLEMNNGTKEIIITNLTETINNVLSEEQFREVTFIPAMNQTSNNATNSGAVAGGNVPNAAGNATTPAAGNVTTPVAGNATTPAAGNATTVNATPS